ncbi:type II secretion system protein [Pseudoalteromonas carrageenovora]|uniref:type II secretion system protein n=1 Tax=Pseudoalteromonas carrageenovora TaxID=227 RepID=UPI00311F68BC
MYIGNSKKVQSAFTLIEVLVAMVIFSLVMTVSVTSYRFSVSELTKAEKSYQTNKLTTIKLINNQIHSLIPFIFRTELAEQVPFFQGNETGFSFITENPIQVDSPLAVAQLKIVDDKLLYCETQYGMFLLEDIDHINHECSSPITYLSGEGISISYFGWKDSFELSNFYSEYLNVAVKPVPTWSAKFSAAKRKLMPLYINISIEEQSDILLKIPQLSSLALGASNAFEG